FAKPPLPKLPGNPVYLRPHLHSYGEQRILLDSTANYFREPQWLTPAEPGAADPAGRPWHELIVEVTPKAVHASWDRKAFEEMTVGELVQRVTKKLKSNQRRDPGATWIHAVNPDFAPRGSLGLYVYKGSASFRQVVVEPFGKPD